MEKLPMMSKMYTNTPAKLKQPTIISLELFLGSVNKIVKVGNIPINRTILKGRVANMTIKKVITVHHFWKVDIFLKGLSVVVLELFIA